MSLPQLAVTLLAKTADFEKSFAQATKTAAKAFAEIEAKGLAAETKLLGSFAGLQKASSLLDKFGGARSILTGFAGAVAGFKLIEMEINAVTKAAEDARKNIAALVEIGTNAGAAGVGTSFFQAWAGQAASLHMDPSALQAMLNNASAASQYTIGVGVNAKPTSPGTTAIGAEVTAGNLTKADQAAYEAAATQEAKIRVVLNLIQQLESQSKNLAAYDLAGKMFGSDFEAKLRQGVDMVGKMKESLAGMSVAGGVRIIPPEEIQRAQEMDARIQAINDKFAEGLAPIRADIARWSQEELDEWLSMEDALAGMVEQAGRLYSWFEGIGKRVTEFGNSEFFKTIANWMDQHGLIDDSLIKPLGPAPDNSPRPLTIYGDKSKPLPPAHPAQASSDDFSATENYIQGLEKTAAALQAETASYNLNSVAKTTALNLAKLQSTAQNAGETVTPAQVQQVRDESAAIANLRGEMAQLAQQRAEFISLQNFTGNNLMDLFKGAEQGAQGLQTALLGVVQAIENAALQAIVLGSGPLAGLFGTMGAPGGGAGGLIGMLMPLPGHAKGGMIDGPGTGTSDSIVSRVSTGEFIMNAAATKKNLGLLQAMNSNRLPHFADGGLVGSGSAPLIARSGVNGGATIHNNVTVNANGGTPQQNNDLAKQVSAHIEDSTRKIVVDELARQKRPGNMLNPYSG